MLNLTQDELHLILAALNYRLEENSDNATAAESAAAKSLYAKVMLELVPF